jgi:hypothetical protein
MPVRPDDIHPPRLPEPAARQKNDVMRSPAQSTYSYSFSSFASGTRDSSAAHSSVYAP